jgi:hypothetical protein
MNDKPELSDVIAQLRVNLASAQKDGEGQNLRFEIDEVEVELQLAIEKAKSGGGGVKFWVLDAKAEGKHTDTVTQKIKLRMKVVDTAASSKTDDLGHPNAIISSPGARSAP